MCLCMKCSKTHQQASLIPKFSWRLFHRTPVKRGRGRKEREGRDNGKGIRLRHGCQGVDAPGFLWQNNASWLLQNVVALFFRRTLTLMQLQRLDRKHLCRRTQLLAIYSLGLDCHVASTYDTVEYIYTCIYTACDRQIFGQARCEQL